MTLFTKSILVDKTPEDGLRVSVMSRHTKNDGVTPHPKITVDSYHIWQRDLAPSSTLVGSYYKGKLGWEDFRKAYIAFLRENPQAERVRALARRALAQDITIMCVEESPKHCHRRILAEECQLVEPSLKIVVH